MRSNAQAIDPTKPKPDLMASKTSSKKNSKIAVVPTEQTSLESNASVVVNQTYPYDLYSKIFAFRRQIGCSTDQEAVRMICTKFFTANPELGILPKA